MARGKDDFADAYVDQKIGISEYALSASVACGKVRFLCRFSVVRACGRCGVVLGFWFISLEDIDTDTDTSFFRQFCCALEELWNIV